MSLQIRELLAFLDDTHIRYQYTGAPDLRIEYFCALSEPRERCITWIRNINNYDFSSLSADLELVLVVNFF
jgi:hypothetical protein